MFVHISCSISKFFYSGLGLGLKKNDQVKHKLIEGYNTKENFPLFNELNAVSMLCKWLIVECSQLKLVGWGTFFAVLTSEKLISGSIDSKNSFCAQITLDKRMIKQQSL